MFLQLHDQVVMRPTFIEILQANHIVVFDPIWQQIKKLVKKKKSYAVLKSDKCCLKCIYNMEAWF